MINALNKDGFFIRKNFVSQKIVSKCLINIKNEISKCATELNVQVSDYLDCTGRWATESQITKTISKALDTNTKEQLESLLQSKLIQKKSNVICKTSDLTEAVPFHQDISYSPDDSYHFSVWIALNDVDRTSGALRIVKNSHTLPVKPAVDFWSPYFVDKYDLAGNDNKQVQVIEILAGDAIIFDSKLWHGSYRNFANKDRFAYVTRWVVVDKVFPTIPKIEPQFFGMFNCGKLTDDILQKSLSLYVKQKDKNLSKEDLIDKWIELLQKESHILDINPDIAIRDLKRLRILHKASNLHNAGDISGKTYKNLWFSLLALLNSKIKLLQR